MGAASQGSGATGPVSKDYEQNFRRGRISKAKAAQLYKWVAEMRPTRAQELYTALRNAPDGKPTKVKTALESYWDLMFGKKDYSWGFFRRG